MLLHASSPFCAVHVQYILLTISPPATVELPFNEDELVDVLVVLANSPADFYVHLVGEEYSDAHALLLEKMQAHFNSSTARPLANGICIVYACSTVADYL